jgi:hypothetical protein
VGAYYRMVIAHAMRATVTFSRSQIIVSLIGALLVAAGLYWWGAADPGVVSATVATVLALLVIAAVNLVWNIIAAPWQLHQDVAGRLEKFERPDVGRLVALYEQGGQLLNRSVQSMKEELPALQEARRQWERDTVAELRKWATKSDVLWFLEASPPKVPRGFRTVYTTYDDEMLSERRDKLLVIIRRIEEGPSA